MSRAGRMGMMIGAAVGGVTAFANWTGEVGQAVSYVVVLAASGWLIGYYMGKRGSI